MWFLLLIRPQKIEINPVHVSKWPSLHFGSTHLVAGKLFSCKQNEDRVISEWINDSSARCFKRTWTEVFFGLVLYSEDQNIQQCWVCLFRRFSISYCESTKVAVDVVGIVVVLVFLQKKCLSWTRRKSREVWTVNTRELPL